MVIIGPYHLSSVSLLVISFSLILTALLLKAGFYYPLFIEGRRLPPGPVPVPLFGNILDAPTIIILRALAQLGRQYGDIVFLNILRKPAIFIGSHTIASEPLEKRSSSYSDRPDSVMMELVGASWILLQYGEELHRQRKIYHRHFNVLAISKVFPILEDETRRLLRNLLAHPDAVFDALPFLTGATTTRVVYGIHVSDQDDRYLRMGRTAIHALVGALAPGKYIVELFPFLRHIPRWIPGGGFLREAAGWKRAVDDARNLPFDEALERIHTGEDISYSLVSSALAAARKQSGGTLSKEDINTTRDAAALAFFAGPDTLLSHLKIFFLVMVLHPHVQHKAHLLLAEVVGADRLPQLHDRPALPYIEAIMRECMRWMQVNVLRFPHVRQSQCATRDDGRMEGDDQCAGYAIPRGAMIVPNVWAMAHDSRTYDDPLAFNPDRFLTTAGALNHAVLDPGKFVFGYGRRRCPGRHFAESALFIAMACVLHAFVVEPRRDADGVPIIPKEVLAGGILAYPKSFQCTVRVRSRAAEAAILAGPSAAQEKAQDGTDGGHK